MAQKVVPLLDRDYAGEGEGETPGDLETPPVAPRRTGASRSSPRRRRRCRRGSRASRPGATSTCRRCSRRPTCRRLPAGPRPAGRVPVHARRAADDVPRPALDDAHVRRASARPSRRTSASSTCSRRGRPGSRPPSISRPSWATTPTRRARSARSACAASRSTRCATWRCSSTASRSTRSRRR